MKGTLGTLKSKLVVLKPGAVEILILQDLSSHKVAKVRMGSNRLACVTKASNSADLKGTGSSLLISKDIIKGN